MSILDIGCGVMPEHGSISNAIGIDINFQHGSISVEHPIIADAHNLPIRSSSCKITHANAILEHLNRPDLALNEINRVLKPEGFGHINIPIGCDTRKEVFKRFFKEFPCATLYTIKKIWKWRRYFKIDGLMHKRLVTLQFIQKYVDIDFEGLNELLRPHQWFVWRTPFYFLHKWGLIRMVYVREMGEYEFWFRKKQS